VLQVWKYNNPGNVVIGMKREFRMIVTRISESEFSVLSLDSTSGKPKSSMQSGGIATGGCAHARILQGILKRLTTSASTSRRCSRR